MPRQSAYRLVIFDFDGTLADTFDWFSSVFNPTAERYSFRRVVPEEAHFLRGLDTREMLAFLGIPIWKVPLIARHLRAQAARERDRFSLFPGAEAMLETLAEAGVRIAVVSSNGEATVRHVLGPRASAHVQHFACGASLFGKAGKFAKAMARLGARPQEALCIGDETRDIAAARKAGTSCGAVTWGYMRPDTLAAARPDHLFQTLDEIAPTVLGAAERIRSAGA